MATLAWNFGQGDVAPDVTVKVAFSDTAFSDAVIVAVIVAGTGDVVITNSALVAPGETVTVLGVWATGSLENRATTAPPGPAGAFSVTVPVEDVPPTTDVGANVRLVKTGGGVIVSVAANDVVPSLAVIVALVNVMTVDVATVNVDDVAPANTVTLAGTTSLELFDVNVTTEPPVGAGASSVTVPIDVPPPRTLVGSNVTLASADDGVMVSTVVTVAVPSFAVTVAEVAAVTAVVVAVNVANEAPAGTVTLAGTTALVELDVNVTIDPPVPACPVSVTVPIEGFPPRTEAGAIETLSSEAGVIVRLAVADWSLEVAVITAEVLAATPVVVIVNVAVVAPLGTVTNAGTTAAALLLRRSTSAPLVGAGWERVTVPVDVFPPTTVAGLTVRLSKGSEVVWVPIA